MKKFIKIISLFISILIMSTSMVACYNEEITAKEEWQGRGVHTAVVENIQGYFIRNGMSEYKIVLPSDANKYEIEAVSIINKYTERATGVSYQVITDNQVTANGKYISIGETALLHESGVSIPIDTYGDSGFRLYTKGNTLFVAGSRSNLRKGTYYAAQEFLKYTIGFKVYSIDEVQYDTLSIIRAKSFDVVEIPEFDYRRYGSYMTKNEEYMNLMRNDIRTEGRLPFSGHSHLEVLPPENYYYDHPDWYYYTQQSVDVDWKHMFVYAQLCLTNQEMIDEFVKQLVQWFRDYPEADFCHLGMQDSQTVCQCENCDATRKKYNTNSAGLNMLFMNQVASRVTEEIQKTEPQRKLYFQTFAYLTIIEPPATYDANTGKWTPHCEEVIPIENVYIQYTSLTANTTEALDHKVNASFYQHLEGWTYLCSIKNAKLSTWNYGVNFNWMMVNHKNWDTVVKNFRIYSDHGITEIYDEAFNMAQGCTFVVMKAYVESMLMWDLTLNYNDLVVDFIENYYGPAAPYVQQAYDQMTIHYEKLTEEGFSGIHNMDIGINAEGRWTFAYVESQRLLFEKAFKALDNIKETDPIAYEKYYKRLVGEYMENMYMQLEFHMANYNSEYVSEIIKLFEKAAQMHDMVVFGNYSGRTVEEYLVKWRGANV